MKAEDHSGHDCGFSFNPAEPTLRFFIEVSYDGGKSWVNQRNDNGAYHNRKVAKGRLNQLEREFQMVNSLRGPPFPIVRMREESI